MSSRDGKKDSQPRMEDSTGSREGQGSFGVFFFSLPHPMPLDVDRDEEKGNRPGTLFTEFAGINLQVKV
jgi:hypothetical protein